MPKRMKQRIIANYRRKGYSAKGARKIAFATMNKRGLLHSRKRGKRKGR